MQSLAEAASVLPWLAPRAASLVALARPSRGRLWSDLRGDPGLVLLVVRQAAKASAAPALSFYDAVLHDPGVVRLAGECLARPVDAFVDWHQPGLAPIYRAALDYARVAEALALRGERCDPEHAWAAGLLAPLGWLAAATEPEAVRAALAALASDRDPGATQQRLWGLDQAALARRLALAWDLPPWLAAIVGHLGLPLEIARALGADPELFELLQLAVLLVEEQKRGLRLPVGATLKHLIDATGLDLATCRQIVADLPPAPLPSDWESPAALPLLGDLLRLASENRALQGVPARKRVHAELDALHEATRRQHAGEERRLHERKLAAMAELAAGAGHEINNPLAVISGQAQYLLVSEQEPARRKALTTIVGQTQRIHQTLTQLMQFARPPVPHLQRVDLHGLIREVSNALQHVADDRQVRLTIAPLPALTLKVDPGQLRAALTALMRNALEAAPPAGWASVAVHTTATGSLAIVVEDSGPGPSDIDREHLFDPFYSGRKAGRGRGLGLPAAWQLARQHGGDVRFDAVSPTRFVLELPPQALAESTAAPEPHASADSVARAS